MSNYVLDIPVIPDLDEVQEEDLTMQVAAPPRYTAPLNKNALSPVKKKELCCYADCDFPHTADFYAGFELHNNCWPAVSFNHLVVIIYV